RSLPRATCRLRDSSPPPSRTFSVRPRRSATRARIASALRLKVSERVSTWEERTVMPGQTARMAVGVQERLGKPRKLPPVDALADEGALVGERRGEVRIAVRLFLQHDFRLLAKDRHEVG